MADVVLISPNKIRPSAWANRHKSAFATSSYLDLREDIRAAGANIQPIKVRPISPVTGHEYEIVYGHRRHHACLELDLHVTSIVENLTDQQLYAEMDRENRSRADLSPWEQGMHYQRALYSGLYPSIRQLASSLNLSHSIISTSIKLAELPDEIVEVFNSPLDLQHRWASALMDAYILDRPGLLSRLAALKSGKTLRSAKEIFKYLAPQAVNKSNDVDLTVGQEVVGKLSQEKNGGMTIKLMPGALSSVEKSALIDFLAKLRQEDY